MTMQILQQGGHMPQNCDNNQNSIWGLKRKEHFYMSKRVH
jgi:hypothetical protein